MKAILIDPMFETVQEVEYSGDYKDIYKLIGVHTGRCMCTFVSQLSSRGTHHFGGGPLETS